MPLPLGPQEVHVWHVPLASAAQLDAPAEQLLDARERERAGALRDPRRQTRFRRAHAATRLILARYGASPTAEIGLTQHGKPYLPAGGTAFSLSHSGDHAAIAVANEDVGIDVESLRSLTDVEGVSRVALSPVELEVLGRLAPALRSEALLTLWTRKEAVLKAEGLGLSLDPRAVDAGRESRAAVLVAGRAWYPVRLDALPAGLVGWLATRWPAPRVSERIFDLDDR